ncbi:hypothetical protein NFIA_082910 [Paecilomyces variotii No. 5]|uniref:Uncharacterized protein n=1 Tax=Byssochlamys spectabilis (strain No. 5 / NBRC 109023) TaxID=1356009 RepID=V5G2L6_BYSSN|nr:hypothetical protein NFIA_082910 [Paecilomyces variotii No. 5]
MAPIPNEAEWLAATEKAREEAEKMDKDMAQNGPPEHPVAQLQGPFEESIIDSNDPAGELYVVQVDALSRRIEILMSKQYERLYHPLWKIVAQMSFGMHLLANGLAKSESEVMKILQGHVDEMDGFVERTTDDLILAEADIRERLNYLKIPLETGRVFDELLEDRNFRYSVMDDTEKIEHINHRSAAAMSDALKDIQKGQEAISALWHYLKKLGKEWTPRPGTFDAVYAAMVGNVEGWHGAFSDLRKHGKGLALVIVQLGAVVTEIQSRAGAASRKEVMNTVSRPRAKSLKVGLFKRSSSLPAVSQVSDKPLPSAPQLVDPAIEAVLPMKIQPEAIPRRSSAGAQNAGLARHSSSAGRRRTRSFDDGTADGNRPISSRQTPENRPGSQGKPAKFVSWVEPNQARPASTQQTEKDAFRGRSRSTGQLREETAERRPQSRGVLGSFVQFEKKKSLPEGGHDKTKDQLLLHLKSKKALDTLAVPVNKLRSVSPRPSSVRRDWPLSIFRAKSSNCLRSPSESQLSDSGSGLGSDAQMEWSKPDDEITNTHTLHPGPGDSPRIPHIRASLCSTIRELDEDSDDAREETGGGVGEEGEVESILTALPALDPSLARHFDIAISQISTENDVHEISPSSVDGVATEKATNSVQLDAATSDTLKDAERSADSTNPAGSQPKRLVPHSADILGLSSSRPLRLSSKALQTPIMQTDNDLKSGIAVNVASLTSESLIDFLAGTPPVSPRPDDLESLSSDDEFDIDLNEPSEPREDTSSRARLGLGIRVGLQCYPEEVSSPPPPGPGGRSMVTPDYSTKYALETEKRLRPRLSLGISGFSLIPQKRSLKRLFSPTWKGHNSSRDIMVVGSGSESSSMEDIGMAHMDIEQNFHFRGLRKDGKWMMS